MLTAVTIENFKGISEPVRLELRPITLLFGQNSSGKSSLLHALIYAREVFERHNLDADRTLSAGDNLDLGGALNLFHNHDPANAITLRFELDLSTTDLPLDFLRSLAYFESLLPYLEYVSRSIGKAEVAVTVGWTGERVAVTRYAVAFNQVPFGAIRYTPELQSVEIAEHDSAHGLVSFVDWDNVDLPQDPEEDEAEMEQEEPSEWQAILAHIRSYSKGHDPDAIPLRGQADALPAWDVPLDLALDISVADKAGPEGMENVRLQANLVTSVFSVLLAGTGRLVRDCLAGLRYLGPNRQVPPRGFTPCRTPDPGRWASGLAGWDLLYEYPPLVDKISRLLADKARMNLGYTMDLVEFREFEATNPLLTAVQGNRLDDLPNPAAYLKFAKVVRRLLLRPIESPDVYLEPADLGVGVGQMIPVLAAALDDRPLGSATLPAQLVAVEHPELNLHPRLQAELADIFLEGALSEATRGRIFFIETHSEVLPLRLFRRVRECTRNKTVGAGDGRGDGSGAGYGDGSGDGRGDGSGAGYGDGSGDGRGDGSGAGYGDGRGDGHGGGRFDFIVKPLDVGVWYVDRSTGVVTVRRIPVDVEGEFIQPWPEEDTLFEQDFRERYS